jgi:hypothetical protein
MKQFRKPLHRRNGRYDGLLELTYPFNDRDVIITACGRRRPPPLQENQHLYGVGSPEALVSRKSTKTLVRQLHAL